MDSTPVKILYLSNHPVLEYDEISLFHELGLEVVSAAVCTDSDIQGDGLRPRLEGLKPSPAVQKMLSSGEEKLSEELLEDIDAVIVASSPGWILGNWDLLKGKRVIWRTTGRSDHRVERSLAPYRAQGLEIVRYSPKEASIPGALGEDRIIRFYKDPEVFKGWSGCKQSLLNLTRGMRNRGRETNFSFFKKTTARFSKQVFGPQNENIGESWAHGAIGFQEMLRELQTHRAYFYLGAYPESYGLNFVEAWMCGIPVVGLGSDRGNDSSLDGHALYEIPDLIRHGVDGFFSDDEKELGQIFEDLILDHRYAAEIGEKGRQKAIEIFGKKRQKARWAEFLMR